VALAQAAGYTNAGTVEFIMDAEGNHYFLEVNTRLQVEHPVTEAVTGIDLVEWQLIVAQGDPLPATQADIQQNGHAIEVRIYAEDALKGFLPSIGWITAWEPHYVERLDSGVEEGSRVTIYYDPMLAKLIVHGSNRAEAIQSLAYQLAVFKIEGVVTNLGFLFWLVEHPDFQAGNTDTGFIERYWHPEHLDEPLPDEVAVTAAAYELLRRPQQVNSHNPWHTLSNLSSHDVILSYEYVPAGFNLRSSGTKQITVVAQKAHEAPNTWHIRSGDFDRVIRPGYSEDSSIFYYATENGWQQSNVEEISDAYYKDWPVLVFADKGHLYRLLRPRPLSTDTLATAVHLPHENSLEAPMPGKVIQVLVSEGDAVDESARLVVMEAMKMELTIRAPHAGQVKRLPVREGQLVDAGTVLVEIE
jgi:3-methylcrotonyl-CoA carboxylase alpha subunit